MNKPILDATCGSRMIWFNKNNELAIFCDKRELDDEAIWTSGKGLGTRCVSYVGKRQQTKSNIL